MTPTRRTLLTGAFALATCPPAAAARALPAYRAYPGEPFPIGDMPAGGWRLLMLLGQPIYLKRLSTTPTDSRAWVVLSGICPHAGCTVSPAFGENGGLGCPCHGSRFDERGRLQRGPATRDLTIPPHKIESEALTLW